MGESVQHLLKKLQLYDLKNRSFICFLEVYDIFFVMLITIFLEI